MGRLSAGAFAAAVVAGFLSSGCTDEISALPPDIFEPNDSFDQFLLGQNNPNAELTAEILSVKSLSSVYGQTANVTALNPIDYFKITPDATGTVRVTCSFLASPGGLDVTFYDDGGVIMLVSVTETTVGSVTELSADIAATAGLPFYVRIDLLPPTEGNTYDLMWEYP